MVLQTLQQVWQCFAMRQPAEATFTRNVLWMVFGNGLRTGVQVIYFLLVARTLQAAEYGIFAGSQALVLVFTSFTSWGSGNILIKYVSRSREQFSLYWGSAAATKASRPSPTAPISQKEYTC
jgi:O-antigen/teichoic acid export membrane protein